MTSYRLSRLLFVQSLAYTPQSKYILLFLLMFNNRFDRLLYKIPQPPKAPVATSINNLWVEKVVIYTFGVGFKNSQLTKKKAAVNSWAISKADR